MKKIVVTILLLFVVSQASAATWVGFGNYIPSSDTTYGLLSALTPRVVAVRTGDKILVEPSVGILYSHFSNNRDIPGPIDTFDLDRTLLSFEVKGIVPVISDERLSFYGFAGVGFAFGSEKTIYQQNFGGIVKGDYDKESTVGFVLPLGLGLQVYLSKNVSMAFDFESGITFNKTSEEQKRGNTTTDLGNTSEFNIALQNQSFRFVVFFGRN
jgi:opacity protein-like surface antigen